LVTGKERLFCHPTDQENLRLLRVEIVVTAKTEREKKWNLGTQKTVDTKAALRKVTGEEDLIRRSSLRNKPYRSDYPRGTVFWVVEVKYRVRKEGFREGSWGEAE